MFNIAVKFCPTLVSQPNVLRFTYLALLVEGFDEVFIQRLIFRQVGVPLVPVAPSVMIFINQNTLKKH
jgi:hypothetical protein